MADPAPATPVSPIETATADAVNSLIDVIDKGTAPPMLEAQRILMERIALEGDVIPSRIKPPSNITEIGGYINLLESLNEKDAQAEMISSILGIAGANYGPGAFAEPPPVAFARIPNDRPDGPAQMSIPTHVTVRADFVDAFQAAMKSLHDAGCMLPLLSPVRSLPAAIPGTQPSVDVLSILGRAIDVVPAVVAADPDHDALAFARKPPGGTAPYALVARELDGGTSVASDTWEALKCDATACTASSSARQYQPIAPLLAPAGWYPQTVYTAPASATSLGSLTRFINVTGLVKGVTKLVDELNVLYTRAQVGQSALASQLDYLWDGTTFSPPA